MNPRFPPKPNQHPNQTRDDTMNYIQLCTKLALDSAGTVGAVSEVTQPGSLQGANAVRFETTLYALTATHVSYQVEETNDLVNWTAKGTAQTLTTIGYKLFTPETTFSAQYVRLKFSISGTGKAIVAAGIYTSQQ